MNLDERAVAYKSLEGNYNKVTVPSFNDELEVLEYLVNMYDCIFVDTNQLMSPDFVHFFKRNISFFYQNSVKFSLLPQVESELNNHCFDADEMERYCALQGMNLISSATYREYFEVYDPCTSAPHADPVFITVIKDLLINKGCSVLLLTADKDLTAWAFNTFYTKEGAFMALYCDEKTGFLTRYHRTRLEQLPFKHSLGSNTVLPEWAYISPSVFWRDSFDRYIYRYFGQGSVWMSASALKDFCQCRGDLSLCQRLRYLDLLSDGKKIKIVSTALNFAWVRKLIAQMPEVFEIKEPYMTEASEEDALYQAIYEDAETTMAAHVLLIADDACYNNIMYRMPYAALRKKVKGCHITSFGTLKQCSTVDAIA